MSILRQYREVSSLKHRIARKEARELLSVYQSRELDDDPLYLKLMEIIVKSEEKRKEPTIC